MLQAGFWAALAGGSSSGGGGGGGSYPSLTLSSPSFTTGKFGQALFLGTATATVNVTTARGVGFWMSCHSTRNCTALQLAGFTSFGMANNTGEFGPNGSQVPNDTNAPNTTFNMPTINDSVFHWFYCENNGSTQAWWMDGTQAQNAPCDSQSNTLAITLVPGDIPFGTFCDLTIWNGNDSSRATPPTGHPVRDSTMVVCWRLDGDGTGS